MQKKKIEFDVETHTKIAKKLREVRWNTIMLYEELSLLLKTDDLRFLNKALDGIGKIRNLLDERFLTENPKAQHSPYYGDSL